jgi:hypothetical protein
MLTLSQHERLAQVVKRERLRVIRFVLLAQDKFLDFDWRLQTVCAQLATDKHQPSPRLRLGKQIRADKEL